MTTEIKQQDLIFVSIEGEEPRGLHNRVNVRREQKATIHGIGAIERFDGDPEIGAGDSSETPDAVTQWVADHLYYEFGIEAKGLGIDVVDVTTEGVEVL